MTLFDAIDNFDKERANSVSLETKIRWLSQLDMKISSEILAPRGEKSFSGYALGGGDIQKQLKAPEEYADIYSVYLNMKLDLMNGEIARYNNSAILFNKLFYEMADFINRNRSVLKKTEIKAGGYYA